MNLTKFLYGHRDPQEAVRRANAAVEAEFAQVENFSGTMEQWDRLHNIHGWNHRAAGEPLKLRRRHWFWH
jgi:hypothetical protein